MFSRVFRRHSVKRDKQSSTTTTRGADVLVANERPTVNEQRARRRNTWNAFPSEIVISEDFFSPREENNHDDDDDDDDDDGALEEDEHRSIRTVDTFLQLSVSNDRTFDDNVLRSMHDNLVVRRDHHETFPTTPTDGVSEVIYQRHMIKGLAFLPTEEENNNNEDDTVGALRRQSENMGMSRNHSHDDDFIQVPDTPTSRDMTIATDATVLGEPQADVVYNLHSSTVQTSPQQQQEVEETGSMSTIQTHLVPHRNIESSCLVTFQRKIDKHLIETTLHARIEGQDEDTMADLVRRLQKSAGVLTFGKKELKRITKGSRQIVFLLPQINKATFSKDEFGEMKLSDVMQLTRARPIVVEVKLERTVSGEQLEIF